MAWLTDIAYKWYVLLSQLSGQVSEPVLRLIGGQNIPALSALLLGLLGGLAPCQVTANAGAIAYVTQEQHEQRTLWRTVWSFIGGKMVVYVSLGLLAAIFGLRIPTPVLALLRKLAGPLMIFMGLYLLGVIRWRSVGTERITEWVQTRMPRRGSPPFWLGIAFSLGFCPTMAMIFFGALVPLVVQAQVGLILPVIFTIGTAVPVILWTLALSAGREASKRWVRGVRKADKYVRWGAAAVFVLLGLNDTLLYWLA